MLFLLRKIRRKLLSENKISKYLLYAISEIMLVVVGILIAVSIDDWKSQQIKIANEVEIINSLEQELSNNITRLQTAIETNSVYKEVSESVSQKLIGGVTSFDERIIVQTFDYHFFSLESPILNDIISKDADVLVERKLLMGDLRLLAIDYGRIKYSASFLDELWNMHITPFFIECGINYRYDPTKTINLASLAESGYSKKQIEALINLKILNQENRENNMINALNNTEKTLKKIKSSNSK